MSSEFILDSKTASTSNTESAEITLFFVLLPGSGFGELDIAFT